VKETGMNPNRKEFLLKDYEEIWKIYRLNYEIRGRWIRFYFLGASIITALLNYFAQTKKSGFISVGSLPRV
jgi:hypothetical protein